MIHVLLTSRGTGRIAHYKNEQTTVAQPAAGPTESLCREKYKTKKNDCRSGSNHLL